MHTLPGAMTPSIMAVRKMTFSITTKNVTLITMTLSLMALWFVTKKPFHPSLMFASSAAAFIAYAECRLCCVTIKSIMLSAIMLGIVILNVVAPSSKTVSYK
jgi:hypothetical protein